MQKTPSNVLDLARLLLDRGAVVDACIEKEPATTTLVSLVTSAFPAQAGVQADLVRLLVGAGSAVNGLTDDGYPLACALIFEYSDAAEALIECGARVDNVVAYAALGRHEELASCFDDDGRLIHGKQFPEPFMREFDEAQVIAAALEHAENHRQADSAAFLRQVIEKRGSGLQ